MEKPSDLKTMGAFALIGLGVLLLIGISKLWPLFIIAPGAAFLYGYFNGGKSSALLAIPGAFITGIGGLLLFQSITGYWESWAYAWILFGVFIGIGLQMMGKRLNDRSLVTVGKTMMFVSGAAFMMFGSLFIILTTSLFRMVLMLGFFGAGGYLLLQVFSDKRDHHNHMNKPKHKHPVNESDSVVQSNIRRIKVEVDGNGYHQEEVIV